MRDIGLLHGASELAMPPILPHEAKTAEIALCPQHGSEFQMLNQEGKVYFCPLAGCFWRAGKRGHGMNARLTWPKGM